MPTAPRQPNRMMCVLVREREIEQVVQLAERVRVRHAAPALDGVANLSGALDRRASTIEEDVDGDRRLLRQRHRVAERRLRQRTQRPDATVEQLAQGGRTLR